MDRDNSEKRDNNPRDNANFFSIVTFFYTLKLYIKGYTKGIDLSDIYEISPKADTKYLAERLDQQWKKQSTKQKPSINRAIWKCYGKFIIFFGLVQFVTTIVMTTWSPKALSKLISYFSPNQKDLTKQDAIFYACLVVCLNLINSLVRNNFRVVLVLHAIKAKAAVAALLYRKSLKLTLESLSDVTSGKIVTIITKDLDGLELLFVGGNMIWIAAIQTLFICYLIYQQIGASSFGGIAFFFVVLPLQIYIGKLTYVYKLECSKKTDERLDLIREILVASKIIKMYTWEKFFEQKIYKARKEELKQLHKIFYANVWITVIGNLCSKTAFFLFVMTYVWTGHNVSAETLYYILSCVGDLEASLSNEIPSGLTQIAQWFAAAKRVESVMEAAEVSTKKQHLKSVQIIFNNVDVRVHGMKILQNVSLTVHKGLTVVFGHTGVGKTTLLKTVLQECEISGDLVVSGAISYASQEPWLFPSTIKNNILFGEKYDRKRYEKVLKLCNLNYDMQLLPEGDNTVIDESGINVSKGQQVRINLARAVYKDSDIYLLDDCLTSLDADVSDDIFKQCICGFLHDKMCIFVTNDCKQIKSAARVILVKSGNVKYQDDKNVIRSFKENQRKDNNEDNEFQIEEIKKKRIYHENKQSGRVPLKDYYRYIQNGGGVVIFFGVLCLFVLTQVASSYSNKLISQWITLGQNTTDYYELNETETQEYIVLSEQKNHKFALSTIFAVAFVLLSLAKSFSFFRFMQVASTRIHKKMVHNVMNSAMIFFDTHFIGNVINRFTKDYVTLDDTFPFVAMICLEMIFTASGGIVLLSTINFFFLLESLLLLGVCCVVKQFCQPAGRNLERLHVIVRGPIAGHLNSTLEGLTTIRASNSEDIITDEFDKHQNLSTSAYFMVCTNYVALSVFLKYVCTIFTGVVIFQFLATDIGSSVGDVGLAITQSFLITNIITSGIMNVADCENLMISVERILEFTNCEEESKDGKILIGWPTSGSICFDNVSLNYSKHAMLNNISFFLKSKEKLGIVGRTGAGKSSIISSLFRLYQTEGTINIDGTNINDVSLDWLRSNISVIPQDPYVFPGTIRENLDPLKQHQDHEIWEILKELHLDSLIDSLDLKIDKGSSFSAGQKQLLCFARVILRKNKIVVLDEVTANVDDKIEGLIQEIIRKYFSECTMLIVAHKTLAVSDCDKIMSLNCGRIVEFVEPKVFFQNKNSVFLNT